MSLIDRLHQVKETDFVLFFYLEILTDIEGICVICITYAPRNTTLSCLHLNLQLYSTFWFPYTFIFLTWFSRLKNFHNPRASACLFMMSSSYGNIRGSPDSIIVQNLMIIMIRVIIQSNTHADTPETHYQKKNSLFTDLNQTRVPQNVLVKKHKQSHKKKISKKNSVIICWNFLDGFLPLHRLAPALTDQVLFFLHPEVEACMLLKITRFVCFICYTFYCILLTMSLLCYLELALIPPNKLVHFSNKISSVIILISCSLDNIIENRNLNLLFQIILHAPAKLSSKLHLFEHVDILAQSLYILRSFLGVVEQVFFAVSEIHLNLSFCFLNFIGDSSYFASVLHESDSLAHTNGIYCKNKKNNSTACMIQPRCDAQWSSDRGLVGNAACKLQAVEQVFLAAIGLFVWLRPTPSCFKLNFDAPLLQRYLLISFSWERFEVNNFPSMDK
ncbi:hypothetical protein VP01_2332g2 [Puccinia sorghi]|uniref:Uncharacterized protein n=1 Tax=Puccinia sorghi TaxID=27349 RepID=A0A0L6V9C5_9BASI|nr:hypothetical protein VP01_2332g2 [Puccinia sorghi]